MLEAVEKQAIDGGLEEVERKMQSAYYDNNTQEEYGSKVDRYQVEMIFKKNTDGAKVIPFPAWKASHEKSLTTRCRNDPPGKSRTEILPPRHQDYYYLDMLDGIPEPTWSINGLLPEGGYTLIYGKRSTKKSFLALDIGLSIATGLDFHGRKVKSGRVVYFAGEGYRGNKWRIDAWFKHHGLCREDYAREFALIPGTGKWDTKNGREKIQQVLRDIAKDGLITLVIIDTARRAMSGDENAPTSVGQFLDGVDEICREFSCGHLIVHHAGKDETRGARGGGPFEDDADAVFHVTKGNNGKVKFICTKQKDDESDWVTTFSSNIIALGREDSGKLITSLALTLQNDFQPMDDEDSSAKGRGDVYGSYDAMAIDILDSTPATSMKRAELARAVITKLHPDMGETDPAGLKKLVEAYKKHLERSLGPNAALWAYVKSKNKKGQPLIFAKARNCQVE